MSKMSTNNEKQIPNVVKMARQMTADEHQTALRTKTKKLVADTLREYDEYAGHLQTYAQTINQLHGPMSPVSMPWIHAPTRQMIYQHLLRADKVCKRDPIRDRVQYFHDLTEVDNVIRAYHKLLADVNYMVRWIGKDNQNWEAVAQMLRHPICQFTYPRNWDEVPLGGYQLPESQNYVIPNPLDPHGVWNPDNPLVHWPQKNRQRRFLASKIKESSQKSETVEHRPWLPEAQYKAMRKTVGQANPLTNEGPQPQVYPQYTLFGEHPTAGPPIPQRPKALLVKEVQQLSISKPDRQSKNCPSTRDAQATTRRSYAYAVNKLKPK